MLAVTGNSAHQAQEKWRRLAIGPTDPRVSSAVLAIGLLGGLVSVVNLVKDLCSAAVYGSSDPLDAYLFALALPLFVNNVAAGSFGALLIPRYIRAQRIEGQAAARNVLAGTLAVSLGLLLVVVLLLGVAGPFLLTIFGSGFSPAKLRLTQQLFYILLPSIILSGLASCYAAILYAEQQFAMVAFAAIAVPIPAIVILSEGGTRLGIHALAGGTLAGFVLQLALLAWWLRRQGISLPYQWPRITPSMLHTLRQYLPLIAAAVLFNRGLLVDQAMAATLSVGSVTALTLGGKIVAAVQGLGAGAVRTALLPHFSNMVAERNWHGLRHAIRTYTRLIVIVSIPIMLALWVFATPLATLVFRRGAFTAENSRLVGQVQAMSVLQIPFYVMLGLVAPLISALQANHYLMKAALIALPVNAILDYVLIQYFGVIGIAVATALVSAMTWIYLTRCSYQLIRRFELVEFERVRSMGSR
jgi:putative peptidoglycan lipid II flippase